MKTPLDGLLRLKIRELDDARRALGEENARLDEIDRQLAVLRDREATEAQIAASDWALPAQSFRQHVRKQIADFVGLRIECLENLDALREAAREAFAELEAVESAAARHREEAMLEQRRAEQTAADEFALNSYLRATAATETQSSW